MSDSDEFALNKLVILPIDTDNIELFYKIGQNWTELQSPTDYLSFANVDGETTATWTGDQLSVGAIDIFNVDAIRIVYQTVEVPDVNEQSLENYIRTLPLMDQRNEDDQEFPPKNWNLRLIEEDDPLFDILVPVRHPFAHDTLWGYVRTEFPYSENVYNMDEYNGSIRPSKNPCDIDQDWIDTCGQCQSSKYNVDLEIENLSNDRIIEAQKILEEFTPFHSVLHSINFRFISNTCRPSCGNPAFFSI